MRKYFLFAIIVFSALLFLNTPQTKAATVTIDPNTVRYTIAGLGGAYADGGYNTPESNYSLDNLNVSFAKFELQMAQWAPDSNWRTYNADIPGSRVHNSFLLMQDLKNRGIPIFSFVMNVADWLVDNPGNTDQRHIPSSNYPEFIEAIKAYLLRAKTVYGVEPDVFAINEANAGVAHLILSASEHADFIRQAGPAFASAGLATKFLAGEVTNPTEYSYISNILSNLKTNGGLNYIKYLSFHTWGSIVLGWEGPSWSNFIEMANVADQYNLPVMVSEVGTDYDWTRSRPLWPTWGWAWDYARLYQASFLYAKAAVTLHWDLGGYWDYDIVDPTTLQPYPIFYVVKHFLNNIPPGSKVIPCNSDDPDVWVTGFTNNAKNVFTLEVLNVGTGSKTVTFNGVPSTSLSWFRTSSSENYASIQQLAPSGGSVTISVPAQSLNTLTGNFVPVLDTTPSTISSVTGINSTRVDVVFSESVEQASAQTIGNYNINNGVSISSAVLGGDLKTVSLTTSALTVGVTYTLTVNNVKDRASPANTISANSQKSFLFTAGLIAHWKFDETSGTAAIDSSGNGNTGTLVNGPVWTSGKINGALSFDGSNDYVALPNIASNSQTISIWIRPYSYAAGTDPDWTDAIVFKGSDGDNGFFGLQHSSGGMQAVARSSASGKVFATCSAAAPLNQWTYVVGIIDGPNNVLEIYRNEALCATTSISGFSSNSNSWNIGYHSYGSPYSYYFNGTIDDVRIYNYALNASEILSLYQSGSCIHKSDSDCNGCVDFQELTAFIDKWKVNNQDVTLKDLIEAIGLWKKGCA